jgi:hypothetical protein
MKTHWLQRAGWFCIPASVPGAIVCLVALAFSLTVFSEVDRYSHPVSHAFHGVFPFFPALFRCSMGLAAGRACIRGWACAAKTAATASLPATKPNRMDNHTLSLKFLTHPLL